MTFFLNRAIAVSLLAVFIFPGSSSAQQSDSIKKMPPLNTIRTRKIDVKHIALDLRFDRKKKQAFGTAAITLSPLKPANKITLDAGMLTINSIVLPNGKTLKFDYDGGDKNDGLIITLDRTYKTGEPLTVKIDYHTNWINETDPNNYTSSFGKGLRFFEPTFTTPGERRQIWSAGEPEYNRYWYPGYDSPDDFLTTEFTATVDKKLMAISNGNLAETKNNADGTRTFHWKMDVPHANHQTSFVVGEYTDIVKNYENIKLHNYSYPDEVAGTDASIARLPDMVKYFSEVTGMKYPYPTYSQVFVQEYPWGGGHNTTLSTISENMVDDYGTHADFFYLWDGVEAQDLAAQWFGNLLVPANWGEAWLGNGFARYFDGLYNEHKNGLDEFQLNYRTWDQSVYLNDWSSDIRRPLVTQNYDSPETMIRDNYINSRAALVLHMLRKQMGDENWWKAIRSYVKVNAGKHVTTEDFRKAVETATGTSLKWFFDQWVYKMGHPVFEVSKKYDAAKKQLTVYAIQTQKTDPKNEYPQAEFFQGKMQIEIDGRIEEVWIKPQTENAFVFASSQEPKLVNFDYGSVWIKEIKFDKTFDELLYQFQNDKDIVGRSNALNELANLAGNEKTSAEDKAKIRTAYMNVIKSNAYWRLRAGFGSAMGYLQRMMSAGKRNAPLQPDEETTAMLLSVIKNEKSWTRSAALGFLGASEDPKFADLYISYLNDESDRVVAVAAGALGKTKSPLAYDALVKLTKRPSWKNQSLMSALGGLQQLKDPRGFDMAFNALKDSPHVARWTLTAWDVRVAAAKTLAALGKGSEGYPIVLERFKSSMSDNDISDIITNTQLVVTLGDPRGKEVFDALKEKFKDDANMMSAVGQYEDQFNTAIKK